jgi:short-subunit dehydrogenase
VASVDKLHLSLAKQGAKLVVAARTESGLESLVKGITDSGEEAILFEPIEGYSTTTGDLTDKTIPSP